MADSSIRKIPMVQLFIASLLLLLRPSASLETAVFIHLPSFDNVVFDTFILDGPKTVSSISECASLCLSNGECGTFFYTEGTTKRCQTHSVRFLDTQESVATPATSHYALTQERCPHKDGYILYRPDSLCYRYVQVKKNWNDARAACQALGAHLIHVKTPRISQHLVNFLNASTVSRTQHVSAGGESKSDIWYWTDGTLATWTNWAPNEPSHVTEECLCLAYFFKFLWNDVPCSGSTSSYQRYYLCQLDI